MIARTVARAVSLASRVKSVPTGNVRSPAPQDRTTAAVLAPTCKRMIKTVELVELDAPVENSAPPESASALRGKRTAKEFAKT